MSSTHAAVTPVGSRQQTLPLSQASTTGTQVELEQSPHVPYPEPEFRQIRIPLLPSVHVQGSWSPGVQDVALAQSAQVLYAVPALLQVSVPPLPSEHVHD